MLRGCTGRRCPVRQIFQLMLLLSITAWSGASLSTEHKKQVHVVVSEEEFEAHDHWEAVLKCKIIFDNVPETGCDIWWTHEMQTPTHEEEDVIDDDTYHVLTEVMKHSSTLQIHRVSSNYSGAYICHAKCTTGDFTAKCIVLNHVATEGTQICSREDFNPLEEPSGFTTGHKFAVIGSLLGAALIIIVIALLRHLCNIRKMKREKWEKRRQIPISASDEDDDEINRTEMQDYPLQPRKKSSLLGYEDMSRCVEGCGQPECAHPKMRLPSYTTEDDNTDPDSTLKDTNRPETVDNRKTTVLEILKLMQSLKGESQPELASNFPPSYDDVLAMVENLKCAEDEVTESSASETDNEN